MYEALVKKLQHCSITYCMDCKYRYHCDGTKAVIGQATDAIEELSKERKAGKWFTDGNGNLRCSECKEEALLTLDAIEGVPFSTYSKSHFCPHCGARMEG